VNSCACNARPDTHLWIVPAHTRLNHTNTRQRATTWTANSLATSPQTKQPAYRPATARLLEESNSRGAWRSAPTKLTASQRDMLAPRAMPTRASAGRNPPDAHLSAALIKPCTLQCANRPINHPNPPHPIGLGRKGGASPSVWRGPWRSRTERKFGRAST